MMHFSDWMLFGMHALWWLFWIVVAAAFVGALINASRSRERESRIEALFRRYRRGDISDAEFDREIESLKAEAKPRK